MLIWLCWNIAWLGGIIVWPGEKRAELTWKEECWGDINLFYWLIDVIVWEGCIIGFIILGDIIDEEGLIYADCGLRLTELIVGWFLIITEGTFEWIYCWSWELFFDCCIFDGLY